jgi:hypothetical protein
VYQPSPSFQMHMMPRIQTYNKGCRRVKRVGVNEIVAVI